MVSVEWNQRRATSLLGSRNFQSQSVKFQRIEHARALIEDTDQPLAEIAAATGFATQSHLTTAFRRATGFTPAAYRRGRRGSK